MPIENHYSTADVIYQLELNPASIDFKCEQNMENMTPHTRIIARLFKRYTDLRTSSNVVFGIYMKMSITCSPSLIASGYSGR